MTVNQSSILCKKRETVEGTAEINTVGETVYEFGGTSKEIAEWSVESPINTLNTYWNNSSKSPKIIYGNKEFPAFQTKFHPCSPIPEYEFLGVADEGTPLSTVTLLDTGARKDSYTIRHEEREGTNNLSQKVGCFCIGIAGKIEANKDEEIIQDWAYQSFEDNGDRSPLTSTDQVIFPENLKTVYTGIPHVTWDVDVSDVDFSEVWRVEYSQKQMTTFVKTGSTYTINLHDYEVVNLRLVGILASNTQWDAHNDQSTQDIDVKVYKQDSITKYKTLKFKNCKLEKIVKLGKVGEGAYLTTMELKAESYTVEFVNEFTTLTDWMPTVTP